MQSKLMAFSKGLAWLLALAGFTACFADRSSEADPPNIVLIVIDDIGYGDLGCYGSTLHKTPNMDKLAAKGMRMLDFHTNGSVCSPTRAALLTGQYQQRSGIESAIGFTTEIGVPLEKNTIAELLEEKGYTSGVIGKWHVGHVSVFGPNDQGFEKSVVSNNSPDYQTHVSRVGEIDWFKDQDLFKEPGYLTDLVTKHSREFIENNATSPFFAFISHVACHFPFQGPNDPPHRTEGKIWHDTKYGPLPEEEYKRAYRDMIEAVDVSVGEIVNTLDENNLTDNTLIFITSDNGAYSWVGSNGPYRGQKGDLFEGGHRVPGIVNWPGHVKPGSESNVTALTMDLLPTFLSIAGVENPDNVALDGTDLTKVWEENQTLPSRLLYWRFNNSYTGREAHAVRDGGWKYIDQGGEQFLFDLESDPGEHENLVEDHPEMITKYQQAFRKWEKEVTGCN